MHITITGELGSGKSTLCEKLNEHLGFDIYSTGKVQRELAKEYKMSTLEFNKYTETNPDIDNEIDQKVVKIAKERANENLIFDSRMAWHFVPHSLKVYLTVDMETAAKRVYQNDRGSVEQYTSVKDASEQLRIRRSLEVARFKKFYNVICNDYSNFDLIIDTSNATEDDVFAIVSYVICMHKKNKPFSKYWAPSQCPK